MIWKVLQKLRPSRSVMMTGIVMIAVGALSYFIGRVSSTANAQQRPSLNSEIYSSSKTGSDGRVVAYIHGDIPITRDELGEFLINRFGAERLETLVSRRIVELACKSRGIEVTDAMVDLQLKQDLKTMNMTPKDFVNLFLRRYNKTLYEWKEDVVRQKLMLRQLVEPEIQVTEEDLRKGFEGRYGPKVECRWIVMPDTKQNKQLWEKAAASEAGFNEIAMRHNLPDLCPSGGKAPPIHKHFGNADIERAAFNMKVGDVSPLIGMAPEQAGGTKMVVILKCDKHIPPDLTKRFEEERTTLLREIHDLKLTVRVNERINELRAHANPNVLLRNERRQDDFEREVLSEIRGQNVPAAANKAGG